TLRLYLRGGSQHAHRRALALPCRERQLVVVEHLQALPLQGPEDALAGNLLPPGARLLVAHDEVLVVDAREVKVQHAPVNGRLPHQTGVTERSIGGGYRDAPYRVRDDV